MAVLLRRSDDLNDIPPDVAWLTTNDPSAVVDRPSKLPDSARLLDETFNDVREDWWTLGRALGAERSGALSHAASCASMNSDLGVMLAWHRIACQLAERTESHLIICDDPWLFRHLATLPNVTSGRAPKLLWQWVLLYLRGIAARFYLAVKLAGAAIQARRMSEKEPPTGGKFILVYGHPASNSSGHDAYFGGLMDLLPEIERMLHTDCPVGVARRLGSQGKAHSLHRYGSIRLAVMGLACRWRPSAAMRRGKFGWLVRRAAAFEGSGAAAAATRWQTVCQARWLDAARPTVVAWPWECHPWERAFARAARRLGVTTIGYQHTVVGRQMFNMTPLSDPSGEAVLPDHILCTGPAYKKQLETLGVPARILDIAGTFRIAPPVDRHDPKGPIFVALAAQAEISRQMMTALKGLPQRYGRFAVKEHPMYPFVFDETETIQRTRDILGAQNSTSAVLYSTGTVGLESMLAGLPTVKFIPEGSVATDIMPDGMRPLETDAAGLEDALGRLPGYNPVDPAVVVSPVDLDVWRRYFRVASPATQTDRPIAER